MSYSISRKAKNFKLSGFFKLSRITLQSDSCGKQFASWRSHCCSHFIVLVIFGSVIGIGKCEYEEEEEESIVCVVCVVCGKIIFLLVVAAVAVVAAMDAWDALEHLL
jgi:hypothetical protein